MAQRWQLVVEAESKKNRHRNIRNTQVTGSTSITAQACMAITNSVRTDQDAIGDIAIQQIGPRPSVVPSRRGAIVNLRWRAVLCRRRTLPPIEWLHRQPLFPPVGKLRLPCAHAVAGVFRKSPDFCDKIAGADFSGEILSRKSGAKVIDSRLIFATRRGPDSGPLRT
jgi:hypothetical protein